MNVPEPTQELESQVYKNYFSKFNKGEITNQPNEPHTYVTDDTGHINLFLGPEQSQKLRQQSQPSEDPIRLALTAEEDSEDELAASTALGQPALTSPPPFATITPSVAGSKTKSSGETLTSEISTPAPDLAAAFRDVRMNKTPRLTQIFHDTQADFSTPARNLTNLCSDPIFERPSPHIIDTERSSPERRQVFSSTTKPTRQHGISSEPYIQYLPLGDSQEAWQHRRNSKHGDEGGASEDAMPWDLDPLQEAQARRREIAQKRQKTWAELSLMKAPSTRKKLQRIETVIGIKRVTPGRNADNAIAISEDELDDSDAHSSNDGSVDIYDEFSQAVIPSERMHDDLMEQEIVQRSTQKGRKEHSRPTSSPIFGLHDAEPRIAEREDGAPLNPRWVDFTGAKISRPAIPHRKTSQTIAVADSQPERDVADDSAPPRPVLPSSINSRNLISQSQACSDSGDGIRRRLQTPPVEDLNESSIPRPPSGYGCLASPPQRFSSRHGLRSSALAVSRDQQHTDATIARSSHGDDTARPLEHQTRLSRKDSHFVIAQITPLLPLSHDTESERLSSQRMTRSQKRQIVFETSPAEPSQQNHISPFRQPALQTVDPSTYVTAHTQLASAASGGQGGKDSGSSQTPSKHRRHIERMGDILARSTPSGSADPMNVDFDVMFDQDLDFERAVAPESRVQTRTNSRRSKNQTAPEAGIVGSDSHAPVPPISHSDKENSTPSPDTSYANPARPTIHSPLHHQPSQPSQRSLRVANIDSEPATRVSSVNILGASQSGSISRRRQKLPDVRAGSEVAKMAQSNTKEIALSQRVRANEAPPTEIKNQGDANGKELAPRRVLARFKGHSLAFYPGTCLGLSGPHDMLYRVRFDDDTVDDIEPHLVKRLEFKNGDCIKVDENGMRQTTFIVRDCQRTASTMSEDRSMSTDIHGNDQIIVESKRRENLSGNRQPLRPQRIHVQLSSVYVPLTFWPRLGARPYAHLQEAQVRPHTPTVYSSIPSTPSTRTRRQTVVATKNFEGEPQRKMASGMFSNMAFALSFKDSADAERDRLTDLIQRSGGQILTSGFDALFEDSYESAVSGLATKSSHQMSVKSSELTFAALISDDYSRRAKYMQALALNLPCLHSNWISDSVKSGSLVAWDDYLLAAGQSARLKNASRSRIFPANTQLHSFQASASRLSETISHRLNFLQNHHVILVIRKNLNEDGLKSRSFLLHALGAQRVEIVKTLDAAVKLCNEDNAWDWMYIDDEIGDGRLEEARARLSGADEPATKKRRRSAKGPEKLREIRDMTIMRNE